MYDFSKVLLVLWRCSLIAPVFCRKSSSTDDSKKYVFCTSWYAVNLGVLCACLAFGLWAVMDDLRAAKDGRSLRMQNTSAAIVTVLQVALMSMVCAMAVTGSAGRHGALLEIERQLRHVDRALDVRAGQPVARCACALLAFHAALFAVDGYLWHTFSPSSWMYFVCYVFLFIELAVMLMYAQIAWSIGLRFEYINAEIEAKLAAMSGVRSRPTGGWHAVPSYGRPLREFKGFAGAAAAFIEPATLTDRRRDHDNIKYISIAKLQELHWCLCNSIEMVNDKFGWQLFLELFLNCVQLIVTPYFMIIDLFYPVVYGSTDIKFILIQVVWILTHLINLLLIVLPTSYASKKGEKTAVIICKYLTIDVHPDDMKQLEIFVLQLQKYAIDFSACGIVNLHRATITTIIGTAITYLVILIQFQNTD